MAKADEAIEGQNTRKIHEPDCHDDCRWHKCFKPCVAYASEVIHSFLAQKQGRTKAVAAGGRGPISTMEALEADPIAWSQSIQGFGMKIGLVTGKIEHVFYIEHRY